MRNVSNELSVVLFALALAPITVACASEVGEGSLELGTGEWMYEPLAVDADTEVPLIRGVQGGYHVWLAARTVGIGEAVTFDVTTQPVDESLAPEQSVVAVRMSEMAGADAWEIVGYPGILSQPACVLGKPLRVTVTLTDEDGDSATDERVVVPTGDPEVLALPPCD